MGITTKKPPQLDSSLDTFINFIDSIDQPQGVHKINTTLFSISLPKLCELQSLGLEFTKYEYESAEYRVIAIILDTAQCRLFRPVCSDLLSTDAKTRFIKLDFINKGIHAVNLPSILRSKSVTETVPTYFKEKEPPIISYTYTKTIASKIFNFSSTLYTWIITSFTTIYLSGNVTPQAIYINHMVMQSLMTFLSFQITKSQKYSHAKLTGIKNYHFCVKLLTSIHCIVLRPAILELICGYLRIPQIYCHHQVTWESIEQLPFTHSIFLPCTSIPHDLLKSRLNSIINNAFKHKNGAT